MLSLSSLWIGILLYHAESKMGDTRELDHPGAFQFNVLSAYMLEQSDTTHRLFFVRLVVKSNNSGIEGLSFYKFQINPVLDVFKQGFSAA